MERTSHTQLRPLVKNKNSQFRFFRKVLLIVLISAEILAQIVGFTLYSLYAVDIIKSRAIDALFASYPVPPYGDIGTPAWLVSFDTLKEDALDPSWGNCYRTKVGSDLPLSNGDSPNTCLYGGEYYNYGRYILLRDSHPSNFAFSSFVFEVNMAIHSGNAGGIIFLYQTPYHSQNFTCYYAFSFNKDGQYSLELYNSPSDANGSFKSLIPFSSSKNKFITTGLDEPNLITVVVREHNFKLYANNHFLNQVHDDTCARDGQVGLIADINSDVHFTDAKIWTSDAPQ